jgi:hypothetical protein
VISSSDPARQAPIGAPKALREVDPGGFEAGRVGGGALARGDHGVQQSGAVEVGAQAVLLGDLEHLLDLRRRPDAAAAEVRRLLDHDQPRARFMAIARVAHVGAQRGAAEHPAPTLQRHHHRAADRRRAARLGGDRMGEPVQVHLVAERPDVEPHRDLVAHRPGGQEDGRLLAEQRGDFVLEGVDGRIETALLVADLGARHRLAHLLAGPGLGVRVEVDHGIRHRSRNLVKRPLRPTARSHFPVVSAGKVRTHWWGEGSALGTIFRKMLDPPKFLASPVHGTTAV